MQNMNVVSRPKLHVLSNGVFLLAVCQILCTQHHLSLNVNDSTQDRGSISFISFLAANYTPPLSPTRVELRKQQVTGYSSPCPQGGQKYIISAQILSTLFVQCTNRYR
jgi:hypothetical protein